MNRTSWQVISETASRTRQEERMRQQAVFRLIQSLEQGDDVIFKKLLNMGIPVDAPLYIKGDTSSPLAEELMPDDFPFEFVTPACWAAWHDDVTSLEKLVNSGADLSFPGPTGRDALWFALLNNSVHSWDYIKRQAQETGMDIPWNARTSDGKRKTRLMDAVVYRNLDAVRDLIGHVDLSAYDVHGRTALHYNFLQNPYTEVDVNIGQLLINYGAPVEAEDYEGVSVASLAQTPEQQALMDRAVLAKISQETFEKAQAQRDKLDAQKPSPEMDPSEPQFPQIQKPVIFKKPRM